MSGGKKADPTRIGRRSPSSHGYILVYMPMHPRAFSNGYVYEHILVAEQKLGRALLPGEEVHHDDEDKQNNHPDNLIIEPSSAHHHLHHRQPGSLLRLPDEANPTLQCGCGCGKTLLKYDTVGRLRNYISGHNTQPAPTLDLVEQAVCSGISTVKALKTALPLSRTALGLALSRLTKKGRLVRRDVGTYGPPGSQLLRQQEIILCACNCGHSLLKYDATKRERRFIQGHGRKGKRVYGKDKNIVG